MSGLKQNFDKVKKSIGNKAELVAVTKYSPVSDIEAAYELGHRDFGENRVQDLLAKASELSHLKDLRWHFIGHLQSNKIKTLLDLDNLYAIHSIDSLNLIHKMVDYLRRLPLNESRKKDLHLFLQINTSGEEEKQGLDDSEEIDQAVQDLLAGQKNELFTLEGLMTMGTLRTDRPDEEARRCFRHLRKLADQLKQKYHHPFKLSMGMSGDYSIALEEGSDYVRIGSKLFK